VAIAGESPEKSERPLSHWTARELTDEALKRGIVERISPQINICLSSQTHILAYRESDDPIGGNVTQMLIDLLKRNQSSYINCLKYSGSEEENKNIIPWKRNLCMDLDIAISTIQSLGVI
jgi:hypothetical protein